VGGRRWLFIGGAAGALIGRLVVHLRSRHKASVGLDEFLALGLIGLAYGLAVLSHTYGFLAVLAAGVSLQRSQKNRALAATPTAESLSRSRKHGTEAPATDEILAGAYMMQEVQNFNDQLERIAEVAIVLVVGAMLSFIDLDPRAVWFVMLLFLVVRPVAVWVGLLGAPVSRDHRVLISWFGIRGIGSIYYLMYAVNHGLSGLLADELIALTLTMVAASIIAHGISVTPLMDRYAKRKSRKGRKLNAPGPGSSRS
jgi:NhaP-type Na+/H+ or K+/H+ antiporter